ncbi:hypothetical protein Tco_0654620 [Tanacetum coccineum]|uniref:Reverse transcriptase domain-containing protein n=1 Tax=Tanacetum coccineum TaxID=301880 RepID=A0ABQ4X4Q6_9ASTR
MIRELNTNEVVSIEFVRSQQNLVDHLMKGLARDLVIKFAKGNGYSRKGAKRKPKTNKSKHGVEKGKVKSQQSKKIQLEGPKLPKPQVVLQKRKTRVKIAKKVEIAFKLYNLRGPFLPTPQKVFFPAPKNPVTTVNAPAGRPLGAYDLGVATPRALVYVGLMTSGDARSWYMISEDAKSWIMPPRMTTQSAGRATAAPRGGRKGGQTGGQGSEVIDGVDGVLDFSTIIAQQLQNLLPTIVPQFLACNLKESDGKGGAIVCTRWIEKMESVQDMCGCRDNQNVKYTAGSFVCKALTWWNSQIHTRSQEVVIGSGKRSIRRIKGLRYGVLDLVSFMVFGEVQAQIRRIFLDGYGVLVFRTVIFECLHLSSRMHAI